MSEVPGGGVYGGHIQPTDYCRDATDIESIKNFFFNFPCRAGPQNQLWHIDHNINLRINVYTYINTMIQINYISLNVSVLGQFFRINDSGLFAWISLAALYRTYLLVTYIIQTICCCAFWMKECVLLVIGVYLYHI